MANRLARSTKSRYKERRSFWVWVGSVGMAIIILIVGWKGIVANRHDIPAATSSNSRATTLFPKSYRVVALQSGAFVPIVRGRRITVVMFMASWCLYCAYEDKYVWPAIVRATPGLQVG